MKRRGSQAALFVVNTKENLTEVTCYDTQTALLKIRRGHRLVMFAYSASSKKGVWMKEATLLHTLQVF